MLKNCHQSRVLKLHVNPGQAFERFLNSHSKTHVIFMVYPGRCLTVTLYQVVLFSENIFLQGHYFVQ